MATTRFSPFLATSLLASFVFLVSIPVSFSLPAQPHEHMVRHVGHAYTLNGPSIKADLAGLEEKCTNPRIRKEWRRMSNNEKKAWLDAVSCMHDRPPKYKHFYPGAHSRFDDFVGFHINATRQVPGTHNTGYFLPFHRYLLWIWENTLHEECGYNGAQPWWDWTLDTPDHDRTFEQSPIFDANLGFGGNGILQPDPAHPDLDMAMCVEDGPWVKYTVHLGPDTNIDDNPRCLERDFWAGLAERSVDGKEVIQKQLAFQTYENFSELDFSPSVHDTKERGGPHTAGHMGVGGEMSNLYSSPNDPLFWVHHAAIDQLWYRWQGRNKIRLQDVARSTLELHRIGEPCPSNKTCGVTTLDTLMIQAGVQAPIVSIRKVVDTLNQGGGGILCYKYDQN